MDSTAESGTHNGPLPSALSRSFRGKFCDVILRNRSVITFEKDQVVYDVGDENPTFFFLQKGFVKIGGITEDGLESHLRWGNYWNPANFTNVWETVAHG